MTFVVTVRSGDDIADLRRKQAGSEERRSLFRTKQTDMAGYIATLGLGAGLGLLTFLSDRSSGSIGGMLALTVSTGSAWALTALMASMRFATRGKSICAAVASLLIATTTYYSLIVVSGSRAGAFSAPTQGTPASRIGLLSQLESMARVALFWVGLSIIAGLIVGWLSHTIGFGRPIPAAMAAGLAAGILTGPAFYVLSPFAFNVVSAQQSASVIAAFLLIAMGTIAPAVLLVVRRRPVRWIAFVASACLSCASAAGVWHLVEWARIVL